MEKTEPVECDRSSISIQNLITSFREALQAVAPIASRVGIKWIEPDIYDEWDAISSGLYSGIVKMAIERSNEWGNCYPIIGYDVRKDKLTGHSYIEVNNEFLLIGLHTVVNNFDTCIVSELTDNIIGEIHNISFSKCNFSAVAVQYNYRKKIDHVSW
ncbi:hypothetical protein [Mesorhizobium sp. CAU 1732]|uniref:hypothetical protein n=1 Tax=Mesorhizobium sp. CAU 1732 TaxID=3140358 RepID=UPI0032602B0A